MRFSFGGAEISGSGLFTERKDSSSAFLWLHHFAGCGRTNSQSNGGQPHSRNLRSPTTTSNLDSYQMSKFNVSSFNSATICSMSVQCYSFESLHQVYVTCAPPADELRFCFAIDGIANKQASFAPLERPRVVIKEFSFVHFVNRTKHSFGQSQIKPKKNKKNQTRIHATEPFTLPPVNCTLQTPNEDHKPYERQNTFPPI